MRARIFVSTSGVRVPWDGSVSQGDLGPDLALSHRVDPALTRTISVLPSKRSFTFILCLYRPAHPHVGVHFA